MLDAELVVGDGLEVGAGGVAGTVEGLAKGDATDFVICFPGAGGRKVRHDEAAEDEMLGVGNRENLREPGVEQGFGVRGAGDDFPLLALRDLAGRAGKRRKRERRIHEQLLERGAVGDKAHVGRMLDDFKARGHAAILLRAERAASAERLRAGVAVGASERGETGRARRDILCDMLSRKVLPFLVLMAFVIGYAFETTWHDPWGPMRWSGAVLLVGGFALSGLARVQLGESFSVAPEAHELVTRGLYSRIRSPIYVFGLVGIAGLFLVFGRPLGLLLMAFLIPIQWIRTRKEAQVLEAKFGESYREYRRHTWF